METKGNIIQLCCKYEWCVSRTSYWGWSVATYHVLRTTPIQISVLNTFSKNLIKTNYASY